MRVIMFMALLAGFLLPSALRAENSFLALCYHDVLDAGQAPISADALEVNTRELVTQFAWLREHGYTVISLDDVLAAKEGKKSLPEKAVMLTFDDGYQSFYERVFPLLQLFEYPATLAVVTRWLETPTSDAVLYGDTAVKRGRFLSWPQIKEMADSGLVEVASHSHDLHRGVQGNPQGNLQPAATTRIYDAANARYESDDEYRSRIEDDLRRSSDIIESRIGTRPRALVWPFGAYSLESVDIARSIGLGYTFNLEDGHNLAGNVHAIRRHLVAEGANVADLAWILRKPVSSSPMRVAHVDLDYVYDDDPAAQKRNLDALLDRIKALRINTVFLQAYADPDGDGTADSVYFPNRHLPVRADLFNRVAWQLRTRAGVVVYAWMPTLAFALKPEHPLYNAVVRADTSASGAKESYRRLSPFHSEVVSFVGDIYADLARHADFAGLLFHDDAYLSDYEDASEWARLHYVGDWKLPSDVNSIRNDPELAQAWMRKKTNLLAEFTHTLAERVRYYRPAIKTARNLYAQVVINPAAQEWFAQSFEDALNSYDFVAVMAMPYMENAEDPQRWLSRLVERVSTVPGAMARTVFELQAKDWRTSSAIDSDVLALQMRILSRGGALNFGYYPDDFIRGLPQMEEIFPQFSLSDYPYR